MKKINEENSSFDFIINTLKEWEKNIPNIKVYYAYDEEARFHDVIIQPENVYDSTICQEAVDRFFWDELPKRFNFINLAIGCAETVDIDNILYTNVTEK